MGEASPRRLLHTLRPSELGTWRALWAISPWGEDRADLRAAIHTSLYAEVHRDRKHRPKPFRPVDFMPYHVEPEKVVDVAALEQKLLKAFGLKLDRRRLKRPPRGN